MKTKKAPKVQIPTIGRIILAVVPVHEGAHEELVTRPAIIVRTWSSEPTGAVNAQVFMDAGDGLASDGTGNCLWKTSLAYDETGKNPNTWHWPTRV